MARVTPERSREKISATVDRQLLAAVDAYVVEHPGVDRSKVLDNALRLWYAQEQERAMEAQYAMPQPPEEQQERAAWRAIRASTAGRTFRER